ncbi:exonuclease domain-containing protein [Rubellimicrobium mesophilum]|nr:exonuclease domain-containing protein [Rubellimicrobium mesophilum]
MPPRAIVFDTETTGFSPASGDRIVEIGAVELIEGRPSGREFHAYINPGRDVPWVAANVHGLTTAFLADKPAFREIAGDWLAFVGEPATPLWAHNASFDQRFLEAELVWAGHPPCPPINCSLNLAKAVLGPGKYSLATLAGRVGATFSGRGAHSALADARVLAGILHDLLWPAEAAKDRADGPGSASQAPSGTDHRLRPAGVVDLLPPGFIAISPAMDARIRHYAEADFAGPLPAKGKRWTPAEDQRLVVGFLHETRDLPDLVQEHGRSPTALLMRLERLGVVELGDLLRAAR